MNKKYDVLIIGTGIAGLYTACNLKDNLRVLIITKNKLRDCNSYLAQGGISTLRDIGDKEAFIEDTLKAGNYKNKLEAVTQIVENSTDNINRLLRLGVDFDKDIDELNYTREGGHSKFRIVHSKDETGKEVIEKLINYVSSKENITILEDTTLLDIIQYKNRCIGGIIEHSNEIININAKATVLATGGIGGIFNSTTNIETITGDGLSIALKHNILMKDISYLQLHPTALYEEEVRGRKLLLSESLRGEGGVIRNALGEKFVNPLLPRDIVSREILKEICKTPQTPYVFLDMTNKSKEFLINRFPYIYEQCLKRGYRMEKDLLPIAPAHHYCMGGIQVDLNSKTSMKDLYAIGEVSCTGVHGSNRLASNSLLEGLVFSRKAAQHINLLVDEGDDKLSGELVERINLKAISDVKNANEEYKYKFISYLKGKVNGEYVKLFNC
ncbi:L-aspartate oxidase [Clostridium sp. UBA7791]|uniref:L-aspartate oxidase n=1 Tax=Clostridium sp. UBA7791 TaxID=1946379 RepID=UPI00321741B1